MMKRLLVILLAVILVASMVACSGTPTATKAPTGAATPTAGAIDWRAPFATTVVIKAAYPEITNAKFATGEDYNNNLWTKMWKERFNVEVQADWVSIEYDVKLNLAIASKTLPDAFQANTVQFNQLLAAGMLADLTSAYNDYASPEFKKMQEKTWDIMETAMSGDKIYGMPRLNYGYETSTMHLWLRKDWADADKVTDAQTSTIAGFEAIMAGFKTNHAAKYGIMEDKNLNVFFQLAPAFHAYPQIWVDGPDGKIVYGATLPETKVALAKWAEWYKNGFVREDFATLDNSAMFQDAFKGNVGAFAQQNWAGWQVGKDMVVNQGDGTYFVSYPLPVVDDKKLMFPLQFANDGYNCVRAGYETPEALIKLIDNYVDVLDISLGEGTMTLEQVLPFNTNDMHHVTGPFKVLFQHYNDIKAVVAANATGVEKFPSGNATLFYNEIQKWLKDKDLVGLGRYLQMGYDKSSLSRAISHVDNDQLMKSKVWGSTPQAVVDYGSTLDSLLVEGYTKIIMGVEPIEYYDTLIAAWKTAGGDAVTAGVNEMYGK
jgi:putative aldouronate transport system substrate-binding protein